MRDGVDCYIGNGVVLDTHHLLSEIAELEKGGIDVRSRLKISPGCPLILPYHSAIDRAREDAKACDKKIGTTGKGIGPTYEDKVSRRGLRVYDLFNPERFAEKLKEVLEYHNFVLTQYFKARQLIFRLFMIRRWQMPSRSSRWWSIFLLRCMPPTRRVRTCCLKVPKVRCSISITGTYPFVTSINCVAGQASAGAGVGPGMLHYVLGITDLLHPCRWRSLPERTGYSDRRRTRLSKMSQVGREFGTVTGRMRRCGWFDAAALRRSGRINGLTFVHYQAGRT